MRSEEWEFHCYRKHLEDCPIDRPGVGPKFEAAVRVVFQKSRLRDRLNLSCFQKPEVQFAGWIEEPVFNLS